MSNQGILPTIRALSSNFQKRAGKTSPTSPSSYAPGRCFSIITTEAKKIDAILKAMLKFVFVSLTPLRL